VALNWLIVSQGFVKSGIPAIGHLGLTPQSFKCIRWFIEFREKVLLQAKKILDDAKALEDAGARSQSYWKWSLIVYAKLLLNVHRTALIIESWIRSRCSWSVADLP